MQNNPEKKSGSFKKFLKDKGYYIVLFLCVAAVGVSGYIFVKTAADQNRANLESNQALSVPLTPSTSSSKKDSSSKPNKATVSGAADDAAETAGLTDSENAEPSVSANAATVRPLSGDTVGAYAMDALAYNETTKDWRTHNGIDIAANVGDQVVAARDGTIGAIYDDDAMGKTVVVNHADGYVTYYGNLAEELSVSVGQSVKAGDVIGAVGETATTELAEQSHLHFAVARNEKPVDPEAFFN